MIEKFGFFMEHLGPNQAAYQIIKSGNELLTKTDKYDLALFYRVLTPLVITPNFSASNMFEAYSYKGRLISLDLNAATRSLDFIGPAQKYYWPENIEWTKIQTRDYEQLRGVLNNKNLPIIARSESYKDMLELTWNSNVIGVVPDFNVEKMVECILAYESVV